MAKHEERGHGLGRKVLSRDDLDFGLVRVFREPDRTIRRDGREVPALS